MHIDKDECPLCAKLLTEKGLEIKWREPAYFVLVVGCYNLLCFETFS